MEVTKYRINPTRLVRYLMHKHGYEWDNEVTAILFTTHSAVMPSGEKHLQLRGVKNESVVYRDVPLRVLKDFTRLIVSMNHRLPIAFYDIPDYQLLAAAGITEKCEDIPCC